MSILLWRTVLNAHRLQSIRTRLSSQIRYLSITPRLSKDSNTSNKNESSSAITRSADGRTDVSTDVRPLGERIKENTKTASYMGVIALGVAVTGIMFYAIFRELFSSSSPNNVYSEALNRCIHVSRHKFHAKFKLTVFFFL